MSYSVNSTTSIVSSFEGWVGGWFLPLSLSLKIRAGVRVKLRSPVAARYSELRGVYEVRLKGRLSIQNKTQREPTATRRLSPHYGQNERTAKDMTGTCPSSLPVPGGREGRRTRSSALQPLPSHFLRYFV